MQDFSSIPESKSMLNLNCSKNLRRITPAGGAAEGGLDEVDAYVGLEPDAVGADEGDGGDGGVADLGGEAGDVVEDGIGRRVEDLVVGQGLEPHRFVFY